MALGHFRRINHCTRSALKLWWLKGSRANPSANIILFSSSQNFFFRCILISKLWIPVFWLDLRQAAHSSTWKWPGAKCTIGIISIPCKWKRKMWTMNILTAAFNHFAGHIQNTSLVPPLHASPATPSPDRSVWIFSSNAWIMNTKTVETFNCWVNTKGKMGFLNELNNMHFGENGISSENGKYWSVGRNNFCRFW